MICLSLNSFNSNPESTTTKTRLRVCSVFLLKMGQWTCTFVGVYRKHYFPNRDYTQSYKIPSEERFYNDLNSLFLCLIFWKIHITEKQAFQFFNYQFTTQFWTVLLNIDERRMNRTNATQDATCLSISFCWEDIQPQRSVIQSNYHKLKAWASRA